LGFLFRLAARLVLPVVLVGLLANSIPNIVSFDNAEDKGGKPAVRAVQVIKVVDGDTFYVRLDGREKKVWLIGVDTPESTMKVEPYGREAAAYTKKSLSDRTVYLDLDVGERDRYGRLLAYVWLLPPPDHSEAVIRARMFNAELLLEGYAQVMTVPPNVKYADTFKKFQAEAWEAGRGLWTGRNKTSM
jgi:micrococcal nuclease